MANYVRLVNGGAIQVRTGVLQGIGPQGPTGPQGQQGEQGPQGPQGEVGAIGQILQVQYLATATETTTVVADTDTVVSFNTVSYDDMSAHASASNITLAQTGDYLISAWVKIELGTDAGDGERSLWISSTTNGTIARTSCLAITDAPTYLNISHPWRCAVAPETVQIKVRSGDNVAVSVSTGARTVTRIGSGPYGPAGPEGPAGPTGPTGPQGATGPAGTPGTYTQYGQLLAP